MSSSTSIDADQVDALLATISSDALELTADVSIVPPISAERARERIEVLLADASRVSLGNSLGEGGRGVVRAGQQLGLRRDVAVKKVRGELTDVALVELLQEAMITGSLEHPNIVPVHYIGVDDDGEPFIVLKKIEGTGWDQLMGERDLESNLEILLDVINAVRFAHSRGIIHRDLKPANVMVGEFGEVYVLDWGLAVSLRDRDDRWLPRAADAAGVAGTLGYMAPEMLDSRGLSERTDVYLLGAILCEMATGRPPHRGAIVANLVKSIIASEPPLDDVPEELAAIIRKAMSADPADRYASADELKDAVEDLLVHRDAARLAANAAERLEALSERIAAGGDADAVYNLFGQCRFGFREAMRRWPDSTAAITGLRDAVVVMAEYELDRGEAEAASRLVAELDDHGPGPPEALRARIDAAVERRRDKLEALEALEADLDPTVGSGWRVVGATMLGMITIVALALAPIVAPGSFEHPEWPFFMLVDLVAGVALALVGLVTRRQLLASRPNRMFAFGVAVAWVVTTVAIAALWFADHDPRHFVTYHPVIWASVFSMLIAAVDARLWPGAVVFLVTVVAVPSLSAIGARFALIVSLATMVVVIGLVSMRSRDPGSDSDSD